MAKREVKCCIACGGDTTSKSAICRKCTQTDEQPKKKIGTLGGVPWFLDDDDDDVDQDMMQSFDDPFHGRVFRDDV